MLLTCNNQSRGHFPGRMTDHKIPTSIVDLQTWEGHNSLKRNNTKAQNAAANNWNPFRGKIYLVLHFMRFGRQHRQSVGIVPRRNRWTNTEYYVCAYIQMCLRSTKILQLSLLQIPFWQCLRWALSCDVPLQWWLINDYHAGLAGYCFPTIQVFIALALIFTAQPIPNLLNSSNFLSTNF